MIRFVSSGTEATMGAIRVARGFTGRDLVVKLEGCYHGGADYLLVKAGSGLATFGTPTSAGVPEAIASHDRWCSPTTTLDPIRAIFLKSRGDAGRGDHPRAGGRQHGVRARRSPATSRAVRELCTEHGTILVFDEVMTGFRVAAGRRAGALRGHPGSHLPRQDASVAAFPWSAPTAAAEDIMREGRARSAPSTRRARLSGNPLAVAAGQVATLEGAGTIGAVYDRAREGRGTPPGQLRGLGGQEGRQDRSHVQRVGSMITPYFGEIGAVKRWDDAAKADTEAFGRWHQKMLEGGVHWPPAQYEAGFLSTTHDEEALSTTEAAFRSALAAI